MDDISSQLSQMRALLDFASDDDKPGIISIIDQLEELLQACNPSSRVSEESSSTVAQSSAVNQSTGASEGGSEIDEYKLFQAEIAALSSEGTSEEPTASSSKPNGEPNAKIAKDLANSVKDKSSESIGDELEALIGMKCVAPHQESWGRIGYHSAMISSVLSLDEQDQGDHPSDISCIMVRVIFLQPVVKSQLFCPFYKEDRCKFSDNECKFSHGEVVPLSQIREYAEPDYSTIVPGSRVLAKYHDDLWYKATVQRITDDGECEVSFDVGNEALTVPLHETSPLADESSKSDSDSSGEDDIQNPELSSDSEDETPKSLLQSGDLLNIKGNSALGVWEQHTKGIGSKLMMKMGYIMGTGLGRNKEGRVDPVDAIVLPPGKSLDACMELKERAKDGNLFSAEKRRLKLQRKADKQRAKLAAQKPKEETDMFEFLNTKLTLRKTSPIITKEDAELNKQSSSNLNKRLLGVSESLRQVNKDIYKTKESMKRHKGKDMETYTIMEKKLQTLESKRHELDSLHNNITKEKKVRSDKRKLDIF